MDELEGSLKIFHAIGGLVDELVKNVKTEREWIKNNFKKKT